MVEYVALSINYVVTYIFDEMYICVTDEQRKNSEQKTEAGKSTGQSKSLDSQGIS